MLEREKVENALIPLLEYWCQHALNQYEQAGRYGVGVAPRLLDGVAEQPTLMQPDGLHPLAEAQPRLLTNVWSALLPLLEATATAAKRVD